jgi:predicted phage terminase large subunit-like protein
MNEDKKAFNALVLSNFMLFFELVFETLHPGELFEQNWHLEVFAWYVKEIVEGRMQRLVVNCPPRSLKSLTFNIALSAYILALNPKARIFGISCTMTLARKHSNDFRTVVNSDWFREVAPNTKWKKNTEDYCETTVGGGRRAASPETGVTGKGATHIIVDDLVDANDADKVWLHLARFEWMTKSLMSRFDNQNKGTFIAIGQRLHVEDPLGALINIPEFELLKIPSVAQENLVYPRLAEHGGPIEFATGGHLQISMMSPKATKILVRTVGLPTFWAQYLQEPLPEGGGVFNFKAFPRLAKQPRGVVFLSVDTGQTKGGGDYTVIMTIGYENERYHILDIHREQVDFEGARIVLLQKIKTELPVGVLIETTGGYGEALLQTLRHSHGIQNLFPFKTTMSKQERFNKIWHMIEAGDVTLPETAKWLHEFRKELLSFPAGKHDDQLDALSQYLISAHFHLKKVGYAPPQKYVTNVLKVKIYGF